MTVQMNDKFARLWSVLQIMKKFNAASFLVLDQVLGKGEVISEGLQRIGSQTFLQQAARIPGKSHPLQEIEGRSAYQSMYGNFLKDCEALQWRSCVATLKKIVSALENDRTTFADIYKFSQELRGRVIDEMNETYFLALSAKEADQYANSLSSWGDVITQFSNEAVFEIDEASKCLALGRSTAAVFHLMRTMEIGVRAVARCLQIPDPITPGDRSWGKIQGNIRTEINARWSVKDRDSGDGAFFDAAYASLDAVKNPWRNATMHVEKKYTQEEAEEIYNAVRAFMRKLASRLDENGLPHA